MWKLCRYDAGGRFRPAFNVTSRINGIGAICNLNINPFCSSTLFGSQMGIESHSILRFSPFLWHINVECAKFLLHYNRIGWHCKKIYSIKDWNNEIQWMKWLFPIESFIQWHLIQNVWLIRARWIDKCEIFCATKLDCSLAIV